MSLFNAKRGEGISVENVQYLAEREVSIMTGIAVQSLRNDRHRGQGIPYHKIGKRVRYSLKDIEDFMAAHRIIPRNQEGMNHADTKREN